MAVGVRCASPADAPASVVLCVPRRLPPGAARCGHCARGKQTQSVSHPTDPTKNPVEASKHRAHSELQSHGKLLRILFEFHGTRDTDASGAFHVDTCFKDPLYYGNAICRR